MCLLHCAGETVSMFRIQKLLLAEYKEIYEPVIVENPFTQVDEDGNGIRQYQIGLTASKLIFGCDDFDLVCLSDVLFDSDLDPEIETFQLVSLFPLQFIRIHFYRKRSREIMKLTIRDAHDKPLYFEFGGHMYRNLFWSIWRDRVATIRLMQPQFCDLTGSSPFTSSDIVIEEEVSKAIVHPEPLYLSTCASLSGAFYH